MTDVKDNYNRGAQVVGSMSPWQTNFRTVEPHICESSIWNFLCVTVLAHRIADLRFLENIDTAFITLVPSKMI